MRRLSALFNIIFRIELAYFVVFPMCILDAARSISMTGQPMTSTARTHAFPVLVLSLFLGAGQADAQPGDRLPTRSFQRFGTSKLRHGSRILALAYSPDGQTLVAGGGNDPVRLWNPKTGELIQEIKEPWAHAITFSASGKTLLFGGFQKVIRRWNFELNKETGRLEGHKATVKAIAIHPEATLAVSGSQDGAVYLWDMNNMRKAGEFSGHADEVNALIYYVDGETELIVSASSDRTIIIWDTKTNLPQFKLDGGGAVHALALSPDGKTLYSAGDDHLIRRWDLPGRKQTGVFKGHEGSVVSLFLHGDTLVSGALDKSIRFWNAKTTEQKRVLPRSAGDCDALAVTRTGDFVATAGVNNSIRIFEAATGKEVSHGAGIPAGLIGMTLSADNQRLAAVSADGQVIVWDPAAGKFLRQWDSGQTGDLVLAFGPDNKTLAIASDSVRLWNADTGAAIAQLPIKAGNPVVSLAFSPDGKTLALGLYDSQIELWDLKKQATLATLKYPGSLHAIAWSPDGRKLAAAGGSKIFLWDPQTNTLIRSFDVKEGPPAPTPLVASLAFGPDSKTLAAGGWDAMIRVYNLMAQNPTDARERRLCEGHHSAVFAVAFSPDGRSLVSGSFDKTTRLWEAFSGKQIAEYKGHLGEVRGVAFAADGRSVLSASSDCNALHWDVPGLDGKGKLPELTLGLQELENAWLTLTTEETARGHEAMWRCIASAKQAVPLLTKKLYYLDPARVNKLFKDLDSPHYPTRIAAVTELTHYGRWMEGRYDAAMANPPSLEYKRRVEVLKEKLSGGNSPSLVQERLRVRRIMLMCEQAGGPDAIEALRKLAERGPEEEIRAEAKASLQRLKKR